MSVQNGKRNDSDSESRFDSLKWALIFAFLVAGVVANAYYGQVNWAVRSAVGILLALFVVAIAASTAKGHEALAFARASRAELRKVVWPTRAETVQTTMVVVVAVLVSSVILWAIDAIFITFINWFAGS